MYYVFINPASQSGKGELLKDSLEAWFKDNKVDYEIHYTKKDTGIAEDFATIAAGTEGPIKMIVVGGDGTLDACINSNIDFDRVELSLIPLGSGNDFIRGHKLPKKLPDKLSAIVNRAHEEVIDIGLTTVVKPDGENLTHRFIVSSGVGYDAEICDMVDASKLKKFLNKLHLGKLVYVLIGIRGIFTNKLADMTVSVGNNKTIYPDSFFICAMNSQCEGGGVPMAPTALDTDGLLNFTLFHNMTRLKALFTIPLIYIRKHIGRKGVDYLSGRSVYVRLSRPTMVHCDGECLGEFDNFKAELDQKIRFIY